MLALANLLAQSTATADTLYACKLNGIGTVRMVSATTNCSQYESKISWSSTGPRGIQGPAGAQGGQGPMGQPGLKGDTGPMGPAGKDGAAGPTGANGTMGATGATGAKGDKGDTGLQGPAGDQGGLPTCTAPDVAVLYNGAFLCKSGVPHYVDNGDGTVTDNQTGLMWEKKTGVVDTPNSGDIHDVNNAYLWAVAIAPFADPNGTLYSDFLQRLNGLTSQISSQGLACFADHCDWRIPTVSELHSILSATSPCSVGLPCIDQAIFGPTQMLTYWTSDSLAAAPRFAWSIDFANGTIYTIFKPNELNARAVRSNR
jgi:hypothetical protein